MFGQKRLSRLAFGCVKERDFEAVIKGSKARYGAAFRGTVCGSVSELKSVQKLTNG